MYSSSSMTVVSAFAIWISTQLPLNVPVDTPAKNWGELPTARMVT